MPWVCYRRRNQWLRVALASFCLPLTWHQCGIKVGLCAGRVRAMPLLVLRHGKQGVKRGQMGSQRLQLKTVIITLLCEVESGEACVCARARAWCSVVCGQWVAWCAHWPFNRMEQDQQVRARSFCADGVARVWVLFRFLAVEIMFDLGVEMAMIRDLFLFLFHFKDFAFIISLDVLVEGIRLHEHAVHGSHGAGVKTVDVLVESRRATEHVIHGHHGARVNAVDVLVENLRIVEHAGRDCHGAGVGNRCKEAW